MNTAIIYYSMSGNCEDTAKKIAAILDAELIRLEPEKEYPDSGFRKFFWGGKSAVMGEMPKLKPYHFDARAYTRVIFGFPVWASNPTPPIRTFIRDNREALHGKKLAAFACCSGGGADKALEKLKKQLEIEALQAELILIDPKDKPNQNNDKMIREFCEKLS
ncbi:MAG: flavodoxin family protein [Anaerolineaceae bacterium]|nr:flavodoxin family protein [Anaerolineaceae bacterium]